MQLSKENSEMSFIPVVKDGVYELQIIPGGYCQVKTRFQNQKEILETYVMPPGLARADLLDLVDRLFPPVQSADIGADVRAARTAALTAGVQLKAALEALVNLEHRLSNG